jgi:hypothetical protein
MAKCNKSTSDGKQVQKSQGYRYHGKRPDKERRAMIAMLKYGKGNNFYLFQ